MHRYVAFLRGINVGGHIAKKEMLQEAFVSLGFLNVSTFKQSGNVIFETNIAEPNEIKAKIQDKLHSTLSYEAPTFIRTIPQLQTILRLDPFKNQATEGTSFLVTFLSTAPSNFSLQLPAVIPKSTAQIIQWKDTEVFSVTHGGGEGALPNPFLEKTLKMKATTRNWHIVEEIMQKFGTAEH